MPWLTPNSIPEDDDCRPLSIPASSEWLALVSGALTELTLKYNWQQFGSLTVDETVAKMQQIVDNYYAGGCSACTTPGDYRIVRINADGHLEELNDSGDWQDATGDYHIPPPEAREEGSPDDQICLAAKNAVNVLEQLYEELSDSWNTHLDEAEAITGMILSFTALVGFEVAPITWAIVAFFGVVFTALYTSLEFIGADLWDANVSAQIRCFLIDCATNTDGVVTFDYECFMNDLNSLADTFSLTEEQLRLYLQIGYMLYFIGGMDGLNLAGRTTAITDDDCDDCGIEHCFKIDFELSDGSAYGWNIQGGTYESTLWQGSANGEGGTDLYGYWEFPETINVTEFQLEYYKGGGSGSGTNVNNTYSLYPTASGYSTVNIAVDTTNGTSPIAHIVKTINPMTPLAGVGIDINSGTFDTLVQLYSLVVRYTGHQVFGSDNC